MSNQAQVMKIQGIRQMLSQIRQNNKQLGITGILLLIQGKFIQYIEGEAAMVDKVYNKIKEDTRHENLVLLDEGIIKERQFKQWSMAYKKVKDEKIIDLIGHSKLDLDEVFLYPSREKTHPLLKILYNFTQDITS